MKERKREKIRSIKREITRLKDSNPSLTLGFSLIAAECEKDRKREIKGNTKERDRL